MTDQTRTKPLTPSPTIARQEEFTPAELNDLCDATYAGIEAGGGFGWVTKPSRDVLERYWQGVTAMPARILLVAKLDGVICGSCQLVKPPMNNEAQKFAVHLTTHFIAPWARGHGLSKMLMAKAEQTAAEEGFSVINLDVRETMEHAIGLYEGLGYERIGTHPYYALVDGKLLKGFYYTKKLR
ncbi:MAG: N-acetyltransferase [Alphaproteobacteria bacterium]